MANTGKLGGVDAIEGRSLVLAAVGGAPIGPSNPVEIDADLIGVGLVSAPLTIQRALSAGLLGTGLVSASLSVATTHELAADLIGVGLLSMGIPASVRPTLQILVDWRGNGLNTIGNDAFLTDTSGWSVAAGISAAGTSITRRTVGGPMALVPTNACGRLTTTATNGSGMFWDFGTTQFVVGRPYRWRVWLRSISGTTSAKILIGSLGTGADRASSTVTLTADWAPYSVDWTPSGTRTDVECNVTNNAASIMVADVCLAEVYEPQDEITRYVDEASWNRGSSFDGSSDPPGSGTLGLDNADGRFSPNNVSSPLTGLVRLNRQVLIRATYGGLVYGLFCGGIRRIVPEPSMAGRVSLLLEDRMWYFGRANAGLSASGSRSIQGFRSAILNDIGEQAQRRDLGDGSPEWAMPVTGADNEQADGLLATLNAATDTAHFIRPHPASSVGYQYVTVPRTELQTGGPKAAYVDDVTDVQNWDVNDETLENRAEVTPNPRAILARETVWEHGNLPLSVPATTTRTIWAEGFDDPTFNLQVAYTATNAPTVTLTAFRRTAKIVITAGVSDAVFSALSITGQPAPVATLEMAISEDTASQATYGRYGIPIGSKRSKVKAIPAAFEEASEYLSSVSDAQGLGDWHVTRYAEPKGRPTMIDTNRFPRMLEREATDRIALTYPLLGLSAVEMYTRSLRVAVDTAAALWTAAYGLEEAVAAQALFTLDGLPSEGFDSGVFAT